MTQTIKNHAFKIQVGTAIAVACFIVYWVFIGSAILKEVRLELTHCQEQAQRNKEVIIDLQDDKQKTEISLAEIKVKLSGIETVLQEIKIDLKNSY